MLDALDIVLLSDQGHNRHSPSPARKRQKVVQVRLRLMTVSEPRPQEEGDDLPRAACRAYVKTTPN
jgi:hypothetical protein